MCRLSLRFIFSFTKQTSWSWTRIRRARCSLGTSKYIRFGFFFLFETRNSFHKRFYFSFIRQKINCLSISLDDFTLASGSDDMNIRVWDTLSKQCLRIINQNASVTNLLFKHRTVFFNEDSSSTTSSTQTPALFSRYSSNAQANTDSINALSMKQSRQLVNLDDFLLDSVNEQSQDDEYFVLKCKYENMKRINEKMYNLAIERIFNE